MKKETTKYLSLIFAHGILLVGIIFWQWNTIQIVATYIFALAISIFFLPDVRNLNLVKKVIGGLTLYIAVFVGVFVSHELFITWQMVIGSVLVIIFEVRSVFQKYSKMKSADIAKNMDNDFWRIHLSFLLVAGVGLYHVIHTYWYGPDQWSAPAIVAMVALVDIGALVWPTRSKQKQHV